MYTRKRIFGGLLQEVLTLAKGLVKITVDSKKASAELKSLNQQETKAVSNAMKQIAPFLEGEVKQSLSGNRPEPKRVDRGRLRGSVQGKTLSKFRIRVATNVQYAPFIEFGTSRLNPGRHFRNSLRRNQSKMTSFVNKEVTRVK